MHSGGETCQQIKLALSLDGGSIAVGGWIRAQLAKEHKVLTRLSRGCANAKMEKTMTMPVGTATQELCLHCLGMQCMSGKQNLRRAHQVWTSHVCTAAVAMQLSLHGCSAVGSVES